MGWQLWELGMKCGYGIICFNRYISYSLAFGNRKTTKRTCPCSFGCVCLYSRDWASLVAQLRIWLQCGRPGFNPWIGKIPWRREWQSTPVFLPGEFHGQRSLADYSPWGHEESDMTKRLTHTLQRLQKYFGWESHLGGGIIHCIKTI